MMVTREGWIKNSKKEGETIDVPIIRRSVKKYNKYGIEVELEWFPKKIQCPDCGEKFDKYTWEGDHFTLRHHHRLDLKNAEITGSDCWTRIEIPCGGEVRKL